LCPGAIAATFVSTDARTFKEPPADWTPTNINDSSKFFGGSPQSLIGDLIREGARALRAGLGAVSGKRGASRRAVSRVSWRIQPDRVVLSSPFRI
jgi:hypothetical protein